MRVASWNVNSIRVRLPQVLGWLDTARPDVLALQETKTVDEAFPVEEIGSAGYHAVFSGQRTYNGVALLSRQPGTDVATGLRGYDDPQRRVIGATFGDVRVIDVYVPNGQAVGSDKFEYKLDWLAALRRQLREDLQEHERLILTGDFNIAPEDRDVYDPVAWEGNVLVSPPEREALAGIQALSLTDTFRLFEQPEASFSWWDYRAAAFRRNRGLRIDLLLASEDMAERCVAATIDKTPRGWTRPSDHAPIFADFEFP